MTKRDGQPRLAEPMESLLEKWPALERADEHWEKSAAAIEARLASAREEADAHADLLEAPLPAAESDGSLDASAEDLPSEPKADRPSQEPPRSLLEIAKMSLEPGKPAADSTDIARESLSLATQARASAPMIAEATRARAAEMAAAMQGPSSARRDSTAPGAPTSVAPPSAHAAPVVSLEAAREKEPHRSSAGPLVMALIGVVGLAAAALIVVRAQRQSEPAVAMAPSSAPAAAATAPTAVAEATKPGSDPDILSIDQLGKTAMAEGSAKAARGEVAAKGAEPKPEAPTAGGASTAEAKPAEAVAKAETKTQKDEPDVALKPAATAGDLPDKPSTGAVQAAIGAVMGSARACVAGQDEPSRASVTFGADGRVQSVSVSGKAAGTPAEACIRSALGKARVQPFARPSYSVGATVRP